MDPAKMKVVDLRTELGTLGLDTKGNKPALVERLKKALEAKTGKAFPDTSVLDTTTEDIDDTGTPRRPAARTTRRRSSYLASTPAKPVREDVREPIEEEVKEESESSQPETEPDAEPEREPEPEVQVPQQPQPEPEPEPVISSTPPEEKPRPLTTPKKRESYFQKEATPPPPKSEEKEAYNIDEEMSPEVKEEESENQDTASQEPMEVDKQADEEKPVENEKDGSEKDRNKEGANKKECPERPERPERPPRYMTEEEEWEELNERLKIREQERLERERKQAEEDAKRFEEMSKDPIKLQRLKRKQEKKQRWSNYYKTIEVTNEVLAPPIEEAIPLEPKKDVGEQKLMEPEINENRITLSWYDSDLNQYLEAPELNSVVPLSEGAFAYAWAGARATHGVTAGRVCYEVRLGAVLTTTESNDKDPVTNGLRVGWSTSDSTLHLGDGAVSWGYESSGRAVHNSEFKEYGKPYVEKDVVGVYLDLESTPCKIFYTLNGVELGTAYEFDKSVLEDKPLFPHILTKNMCYKVNMGYEKYNMLTKTKIVRQRIEVPVEQVLEEKRQRDEIVKARKEELARKKEERRQKVRREREERKKKKREERRKQREEQEKEDGDKKDGDGEDDKKDAERNDDSDGAGDDSGDGDASVKENGDKSTEAISEEPPKEAEVMETEQAAEAPENKNEETDPTDSTVKQESEDNPVPEVTEEQVLQGVTLDKRIQFVIRNLVEEELDGSEACLVPGYVLIAHAELEPGPQRPDSLADCEVILMVGMPGAGKTHWATRHVADNPQRRYNILSTSALFDNMQVDCKPFRTHYEGRWDAMVSKGAKCVLKLLEIAKARLRNYILDQTNVYPSAQRRKLREFEGRRRVAAVVVPEGEEYRRRLEARPAAGKEVPDGAVLDMKANFSLPEKCAWIDEVIFTELDREEAEKVVEAFHKEAKAAGVTREREKRDRSASKDAPPAKRQRSSDRRQQPRDDRRRDFGREREDRWGGGGGGGGGGSRWGPANRGGGGGGGRWSGGGRDRGGMGGPPGRFDRGGWQPQQNNREYGRERDGFRGGRGGGAGGRGPRDGRDGRNNERGFSRDRARPPPPHQHPHPHQDKRQGPPPPPPHHGNNSGGGGGAGSWQRGGGQVRPPRPGPPARHNQKDGPNHNQNQNQGQQGQNQNQGQGQNQGWNQWAGGWGGWGNWGNQNQGWGNWGNWGWNPGQNAQMGQQQMGQQQGQMGQQGQQLQGKGQAGAGAGGAGGAAGAAQQQWPANYTAQQWYQWQQWQQQQQGWPGYQQQGNSQQSNTADQTQAWAQYYQNYGGANTGNAGAAAADKK